MYRSRAALDRVPRLLPGSDPAVDHVQGPLDPGHLAALDSPGRHPPAEEAAELADPDSGRELRRAAPVLVVPPDEHDLLAAVGDPRELRAEACAQHRDRH